MSTLGQRLEKFRTERKLTKEQVARVRGATVGSWERDKIIPRDDKLKRLSSFFEVSYEWLRVGVDSVVLLSTTENMPYLNSHCTGQVQQGGRSGFRTLF